MVVTVSPLPMFATHKSELAVVAVEVACVVAVVDELALVAFAPVVRFVFLVIFLLLLGGAAAGPSTALDSPL